MSIRILICIHFLCSSHCEIRNENTSIVRCTLWLGKTEHVSECSQMGYEGGTRNLFMQHLSEACCGIPFKELNSRVQKERAVEAPEGK